MTMKWYVIHTYSSFENKVKASIESRAEALGLKDRIGEILIPSEDVVEMKKGEKKISSRKFYPGYLLACMEMSDEVWYFIKSIPKVTGFVGPGTKPTPLSEEEVEHILRQVTVGAEKPTPKVLFAKGEHIRVVEGPFANFTGVVEEVKPDRGKLKVMVTIFGRQTPLELDFLQVEKV